MAIDNKAALAASPAAPGETADTSPLAFGPFVLDVTEARLTREGQLLALPPRPLAVLTHLARHAGRLVSKDALLDAVWGHRHVTESVLKVCVNTLRATLGDDAKQPRWIETVARRGYRFVGQVTPLVAVAPLSGATQGNLPASAGPLVGREPELAALLALLAKHRLVTLTGCGGIGKTCLALELATCAADRFAQGAWLVRLDALADGDALVATVARTLRLSAAAGAGTSALVQALASQSLLLVLDNCEHLLDVIAPLVRSLLADAGGVTVLTTSQEPLRLENEQLWQLAPLRCPAASEAAEAEQFSAVALLLQRIRQRQPGFVLDDAGRTVASTLCASLDGLPLALELAAARVPLLGLEGVLQRLPDSLQLLTQGAGARDAAPRQRTLRATLEWSCMLLAPAEQELLCRLGVFAGSFPLSAAEALACDLESRSEPVLDMLGNLLDKSLVVRVVNPPSHGGRGAEPRLRLYDHIRAFALEGLEARGGLLALQARHAEWMAQVLRAAAATAHDTPTLIWIDALLPELDNLRQALRHGLHHAPLQAIALCADAMWLWQRGGLRHEALRWWSAVQALPARDEMPEALRAALQQAQGVLFIYGLHGQAAEVVAMLTDAVARHRGLGDALNEYFDLYLLQQALLRFEPHIDRPDLRQRMAALETPDWSEYRRRYLRSIEGTRMRDTGDAEAYRRFCIEEIERLRQAGDQNLVWVWSYGLALAEHDDGHAERAIARLGAVVEEIRAAGLLRVHATLAVMLACMRLQQGELPQCLPAAREAVALLRADGALWWMGSALALAAWWRGEAQHAALLLGWSDALLAQRGERAGPFFGRLRADCEARLRRGGLGADAIAAALSAGAALDEAQALRLAFGS